MTAALDQEILRCTNRATGHLDILEGASTLVFDIIGEIHRDSTAQELLRGAHGIRALVAQAFGALEELQYVAGRLDAIAAIKTSPHSVEDSRAETD